MVTLDTPRCTDVALSPPKPSLPGPSRSRTIREGDCLFLKLPSGQLKQIMKLDASQTISLGKFGCFNADALVGQPYGLTYEVNEHGKLRAILNTSISELYQGGIDEIEATNEHIQAAADVQSLTFLDIESLKDKGVGGHAIIQKQIEKHSAFEQKTEFSKEKYIRRKQQKFMRMFTALEPTVHEVVSFHFENGFQNLLGLRPDSLGQMLALANVRPGWKGIVVDSIGGLLTAAVLERIQGDGSILVINDADSPPDQHLLQQFNFSSAALTCIRALNWAQTQKTWTPPSLPLPLVGEQPDAGKATGQRARNTKDQSRAKKRKGKVAELMATREDLFNGTHEGLIACTQYDPASVITHLTPYLVGSSSIAVFSSVLDPLGLAQQVLRDSPNWINVNIHEPWLRKYQVLPGRTHPEMNGMNGGGFILSATRVLVPDSASGRGKRKREDKVDA